MLYEMNFTRHAYNSERINTIRYRAFSEFRNAQVRRVLWWRLKVYATNEEKKNWLKSYHVIFNNQ